MSRRGRGGRAKGGNKQELTEEQKQEIREAFDLFDTDGSGKHRARNPPAPSPQSSPRFAGSLRVSALWVPHLAKNSEGPGVENLRVAARRRPGTPASHARLPPLARGFRTVL